MDFTRAQQADFHPSICCVKNHGKRGCWNNSNILLKTFPSCYNANLMTLSNRCGILHNHLLCFSFQGILLSFSTTRIFRPICLIVYPYSGTHTDIKPVAVHDNIYPVARSACGGNSARVITGLARRAKPPPGSCHSDAILCVASVF